MWDTPPLTYRSKVKVIVLQRSWMYLACCLMAIHLHVSAKFGMPMLKGKDHFAQTQIQGDN